MLIDAHAHLDRYGSDSESAIAEIESRSILTVSNSMDLRSYERNLALAGRSSLIVPTFGIHPWNAPDWANRLDELGPAIERTPMLGEVGLDHRYVEDETLYAAQTAVFEFLLAAASRRGKAVSVHTSGAESEVLNLLDRHGVERVIVHWYSGPMGVFRRLVERGAHFTIGVEVMTSGLIRRIAAELPDRLLLTETDNPGGMEWLRGERGMPGALEGVVRELASIRNTTSEDVKSTVAANFLDFITDDRGFEEVVVQHFAGGRRND